MLTPHVGIYGERAWSEGGAGGKAEGQNPDSFPNTGLRTDTFSNILATRCSLLAWKGSRTFQLSGISD